MENKENSCEIPFWKDPSVLYRRFSLEYRRDCEVQIWNFITRVVIIAVLSGIILSVVGGISTIPIVFVFAAVLVVSVIVLTPPANNKMQHSEDNTEPKSKTHEFVTEGFNNTPISATTSVVSQSVLPTSRNPFMNVLADELGTERNSAAPADDPTVKQTLDDYFRVQWFSDPTDVYGKNQGQRQFITQPSTSVPNDRKSFQEWLYKIPGKTCKEGGRALCKAGTDGSPVTWLNQRL